MAQMDQMEKVFLKISLFFKWWLPLRPWNPQTLRPWSIYTLKQIPLTLTLRIRQDWKHFQEEGFLRVLQILILVSFDCSTWSQWKGEPLPTWRNNGCLSKTKSAVVKPSWQGHSGNIFSGTRLMLFKDPQSRLNTLYFVTEKWSWSMIIGHIVSEFHIVVCKLLFLLKIQENTLFVVVTYLKKPVGNLSRYLT